MNGPTTRTGWVKAGLLTALIAGGGAGGLYLSGGWQGGATPPSAAGPSADPQAAHRFALSAADAKDTLEAPELAADPTGRVYLVWASQTGPAERTVRVARSDDAGASFLSPTTVARTAIYKSVSQMKGKTVSRELRAVPHVVAGDGPLQIVWTEALPDSSGVRLVRAESRDEGTTLGTPQPLRPGPYRPTFTALAVGPGGTLACSWLDNRERAQLPFAAVRPAGAAGFEPERVVHLGQGGKGVCPCCPTAACFAPDGTLYVAFRNIRDGYRDIAVGRLRPGAAAFDGPFPVVENTWKFDGCPHDGPSLAVAGGDLHVVWMDARTGAQRCYHARANRSDMRFEARDLNPAGPGTQGNAKLLADPAGRLHAVWEASLTAEPPAADTHAGHRHDPAPPQVGAGGGRAILYAMIAPGAARFGPARAVAARPGAFQTRPTIAAGGGGVVVAWNELDEAGKAVVVTRLPREAGRD